MNQNNESSSALAFVARATRLKARMDSAKAEHAPASVLKAICIEAAALMKDGARMIAEQDALSAAVEERTGKSSEGQLITESDVLRANQLLASYDRDPQVWQMFMLLRDSSTTN